LEDSGVSSEHGVRGGLFREPTPHIALGGGHAAVYQYHDGYIMVTRGALLWLLLSETPGLFEQAYNLSIRNLREVPVIETDGFEVLGRLQTDQIVGLSAEQLGGLLRADGDGENEPSWV
jgi:hypothetical protein